MEQTRKSYHKTPPYQLGESLGNPRIKQNRGKMLKTCQRINHNEPAEEAHKWQTQLKMFHRLNNFVSFLLQNWSKSHPLRAYPLFFLFFSQRPLKKHISHNFSEKSLQNRKALKIFDSFLLFTTKMVGPPPSHNTHNIG